jgi:hypothetical protein
MGESQVICQKGIDRLQGEGWILGEQLRSRQDVPDFLQDCCAQAESYLPTVDEVEKGLYAMRPACGSKKEHTVINGKHAHAR